MGKISALHVLLVMRVLRLFVTRVDEILVCDQKERSSNG